MKKATEKKQHNISNASVNINNWIQFLVQFYQKNFDTADAGYPLHLALYSADKKFNPRQSHLQNKTVILINNGIHPGEPDGIDASMMLRRDIASGKIRIPGIRSVVLAIIPVYNIGGCLNRNSYPRVNQHGWKLWLQGPWAKS